MILSIAKCPGLVGDHACTPHDIVQAAELSSVMGLSVMLIYYGTALKGCESLHARDGTLQLSCVLLAIAK